MVNLVTYVLPQYKKKKTNFTNPGFQYKEKQKSKSLKFILQIYIL